MDYPIIVGIISGLSTSAIIFCIVLLWNKMFIKWLDNKIYKGTRIDGTWQTTMITDAGTTHESVTLEQYGNRITGIIDYPKDTEGKCHRYIVEGKFQDGTLILLQEETGQKHQDLGGVVLNFKQGGANPIMEGLGVWSDEGKIVSVPYKWIGT